MTEKKLKGGGWLRKCGPFLSDGVGTNGENGGGDGRPRGLWALGLGENRRDGPGQRSDAEGRARRHRLGLRSACGYSTSALGRMD